MWCRLGNKWKSDGKYKKSLKKKLCFIQEKSTFGRTHEWEKGMNRHQKLWQIDGNKTLKEHEYHIGIGS